MKNYVFLMVVFFMSGNIVWAQNKKQDWKPITYKGKSYLSGGLISGGKVSKAVFDSLIAYPLIVRDSLNIEHTATAYYLTYAERGLFEDSTGHPMIMTDYTGVHSEKGHLPAYWLSSLQERTKAGDTVLIDNIIFLSGEAKPAFQNSEPIKLILTP